MRKTAEEAERGEAGAFCERFLAPIKKAVSEMPAKNQKGDEAALLASFDSCVDKQLTKLRKEVDNAQEQGEPVGLLLKLHGDLIRLKIENGHLNQDYSARRGTIDAMRAWFESRIKQCNV